MNKVTNIIKYSYDENLFKYHIDCPKLDVCYEENHFILAGWLISNQQISSFSVSIDGLVYDYKFNKNRPDVLFRLGIDDANIITYGFEHNIIVPKNFIRIGVQLEKEFIWFCCINFSTSEFLFEQHDSNTKTDLIFHGDRNYINKNKYLFNNTQNQTCVNLTLNEDDAKSNNFEYATDLIKYINGSKANVYNNIFLADITNVYKSEVKIRSLIASTIKKCNFLSISEDKTKFNTLLRPFINRITKCLDLNQPSVLLENDIIIVVFDFTKLQHKFMSIHNGSLEQVVQNQKLDNSNFLLIIQQAIEIGSGFSFIRVNHCENRILGYKYSFGEEDVNTTYSIQFGNTLEKEDSSFISSQIKIAIENANVIGLPTRFPGLNSDLSRIMEYSSYIHLRDFSLIEPKHFVDVTIHLRFFYKQEFADFLKKIKKLSVIGSRDVVSVLENNLEVKVVKWYRIPQEYKYKDNLNQNIAHYPDVFNSIINDLQNEVSTGDLFLVGGGILGKIYCETIRKCGGVAIDVGSFMDYLVGFQTRGPKDYWPKIEWIKE